MSSPADLALVGQDPALGGGALAKLAAMRDAARAVGREPELVYLRYPRLPDRDAGLPSRGVRPLVPNVDPLNHVAAGLRLAPGVRRARTVFVVSTVASSGVAARASARSYGVWATTSLADEWAGRRDRLDLARRTALRLGGPSMHVLERTVLRGATVRWAISPYSQRSLARASGLHEREIDVVPIPLDARRWEPLPDDEWRARLDEPELVFVGRADDPRKNVELLFRALPRIPRARLTLVGTPPGGALPERVRAAGVVDDVAAIVRQAALLVLPSRQEGFGLVVAEALAAGVPVLVTPSGGPEELVRASGGGVVAPDFSPDAFAEHAASLLADPDGLAAMRERGRRYVLEQHAPERLAAALRDALARLDG